MMRYLQNVSERHRATFSGPYNAVRSAIQDATTRIRELPASASTPNRSLPFGTIIAIVLTLGAVAIPILLAQNADPNLSVATVAPLIVAILAIVTYALGISFGLLGCATGILLFAGWFADSWSHPAIPPDPAGRITMAIFASSSLVVIWLVRRIGLEGSTERQETLAARSAATALSAIETVAATQHDLTPLAEAHLHDAIVRAVVSVNRVHGGALLLAEEVGGKMQLTSSYGLGHDDGKSLLLKGDGKNLIDAVSRERRIIQARVPGDHRALRLSEVRSSRMRTLMAAPVIAEDEQLAGVLVIGLLVEHQFTTSEIRRLSALASQVATIIETMTVTSKREAQLRYAQNEQKQLERVIAAVPEALVICAPPDGRVVAINDAARSLFRSDEHALKMDTVRPVGPDASTVDLPLVATLASAQSVGDVECVVEHDDRTVTPVLASAAPILDPSGDMLAVVTSFRDITSLKEASRIRDEFVSVVSHELRSPLTPIRGFVQLVARELSREEGHEKQVNRLNSIAGHVDRLTRLVDDLLDVSSLRSGTLEIRAQPTDLVEICEQVAALRSADESVEQVILVNASEEDIRGNWDRDRVQQIIDNLVGNALKYSPADSTVSINVTLDSGIAQAAIVDQGGGIAPELQEEIFGAFYRTPDATTGQIPGLGLGLYICQALAAAHHGSIDYTNAENGSGSEFRLRLPAIAPVEEPEIVLPDAVRLPDPNIAENVQGEASA